MYDSTNVRSEHRQLDTSTMGVQLLNSVAQEVRLTTQKHGLVKDEGEWTRSMDLEIENPVWKSMNLSRGRVQAESTEQWECIFILLLRARGVRETALVAALYW